MTILNQTASIIYAKLVDTEKREQIATLVTPNYASSSPSMVTREMAVKRALTANIFILFCVVPSNQGFALGKSAVPIILLGLNSQSKMM